MGTRLSSRLQRGARIVCMCSCLILLLAMLPATEADGAARILDDRAALPAAPALAPSVGLSGVQTVFLIVMENHTWSEIKGSPSAPYINNTLLPLAAHAEQYDNLPGIHPSLPNYLWLEAGTNFGVSDDADPGVHHQSTTQHLTTLLQNAGIAWKSYQEDISGTICPLTSTGLYAPKHDPMVYFDDVTNTNSPASANCIAHVRPYGELANDLTNNTVARYNFITPNLCDDMHNFTGCATNDQIKNGDDWLAANVPAILNSTAYQNNGALFITWDESEGGDFPIGMIALSPLGRPGYASTVAYTHSSTLRTMQEIFGVTPFLGGAATATDLCDLFAAPSITLSPTSLPIGIIGTAYNARVTACGGASPYTFAVTSGALPPGLTLATTGVLSGTPTTAGSSAVTVTTTDHLGAMGSRAYTLVTGPYPLPPVPQPSVVPVIPKPVPVPPSQPVVPTTAATPNPLPVSRRP